MITEAQLPMTKRQLIEQTGITDYALKKLIRKRLVRGNIEKAPAASGKQCLQFVVYWANLDVISYHAARQVGLPL